jgi:hypothetical protein
MEAKRLLIYSNHLANLAAFQNKLTRRRPGLTDPARLLYVPTSSQPHPRLTQTFDSGNGADCPPD